MRAHTFLDESVHAEFLRFRLVQKSLQTQIQSACGPSSSWDIDTNLVLQFHVCTIRYQHTYCITNHIPPQSSGFQGFGGLNEFHTVCNVWDRILQKHML